MNHDHDNAAPCPRCVVAKNQTGDKAFSEKFRAFLGVCGCLSCYVAMFPAILLGVMGIIGLSATRTLDALNAYMSSILFQPILVISILFLIIGLLRYGKISLILSIIAGLGIFVSMNFYMTEWLFTLSFGILALAYYLAYQKTKAQPLKITLVLLLVVVVLGVIDIGRTAFVSSSPGSTLPPAIPQNMMDMMQ